MDGCVVTILKHDWINIGSLRLNRVHKQFRCFFRVVEELENLFRLSRTI